MANRPSIKNAGSAPIYREIERLTLDCLVIVERTPNSVGVRRLSKHLIDNLLDCLTLVSLALNEKDAIAKLEMINSLYMQMRTVKTCIDTLKEWSNRSVTRIISNRQMPKIAEALDSIFHQVQNWRAKAFEQQKSHTN